MHIHELLKLMIEKKASDVHIKAGRPPLYRIHGILEPMDQLGVISNEQAADLARQILPEKQRDKVDVQNEIDTAYNWEGVARFRANIFRQRGLYTIVMRVIPAIIPALETLDLPAVIAKIATTERGLVLVTGATGSGKSTTLAGMINTINETMANHIVTVEDPIEFVHLDKKSSVCQREVGLDTETFSSALRYLLRQDPDVILIGEMRDKETVHAAITAAETGHMVFSTLHTIDAIQTIDRVIDFFPDIQQNQVRQQLAMGLKAVISQRLVTRADGTGRVPACEIMVCTPTIRGLIMENKINQIRTFIREGAQDGMQSFDQALVNLYKSGKITKEEAMINATSPQEIELAMKGISTSKGSAQNILASMADQQSKVTIAQSMDRGLGYLKRQMFMEAAAEFKKVMLEDPNHAQAKAYMKEINERQAKSNLTQDAKTYIRKGLELYQGEKIEEAISMWENALRMDPENAQAKAYISGAQDRMGVVTQVNRLIQQGVEAYQAGDLAASLAAWDEAARLDPGNEQADTYLREGRKRLKEIENDRDAKQHFVQGATHYQNGELLEAAMEWSAALKYNSNYQEALEYRSEAQRLLQQEGLPGYDAGNPEAAQAQSFYQAGVKNFVDLKFSSAVQEFRKASEKNPAYGPFQTFLDLAVRHNADYMSGLNEKAMRALSESRLEDAVVFWREALENDPSDQEIKTALAAAKPTVDQAVSSYYSQAVEFSQANKHREAIRLLEKVVILDPTHDPAKRRLEDSRQKLEKLKGILSQIKE